jgi:cell wall-associated NlpC family hydrolase
LAFNNESTVLAGQVSVLGVQDLAADSGLAGALSAAGAGREQMGAVIAAAQGDITSLAAATASPAGQQALVNALTRRLEQTWQALTNGHADASTRVACSAQVAAAYSGLGNYPGRGLASTSPMSCMAAMSPSMSPMSALSPMQNASMLTAETMAANQAASSGAQAAGMAQQSASNTSNNGGKTATQASATYATTDAGEVRTVVKRAMSQLGVPYVYGGGGPKGPTGGGFDCSSLMQYAYSPYVQLPRVTYDQVHVGHTVSRSNIQPGDLIFSYFGEREGSGPPNLGPGHVQMAIGYGPNSEVIEAPSPGGHVQLSRIPSASDLAQLNCPNRIQVQRILG